MASGGVWIGVSSCKLVYLDISSNSQLGTLLYAVRLNSLGVERRPISLCETVGLSERWSLHIFVYISS